MRASAPFRTNTPPCISLLQLALRNSCVLQRTAVMTMNVILTVPGSMMLRMDSHRGTTVTHTQAFPRCRHCRQSCTPCFSSSSNHKVQGSSVNKRSPVSLESDWLFICTCPAAVLPRVVCHVFHLLCIARTIATAAASFKQNAHR